MEESQKGTLWPRPRGLANADSEEKQEPGQSSASAASARDDAKIDEELEARFDVCGRRATTTSQAAEPQSSLPSHLMVAASWWSPNAKAKIQGLELQRQAAELSMKVHQTAQQFGMSERTLLTAPAVEAQTWTACKLGHSMKSRCAEDFSALTLGLPPPSLDFVDKLAISPKIALPPPRLLTGGPAEKLKHKKSAPAIAVESSLGVSALMGSGWPTP